LTGVRLCPECDTRCGEDLCPECGARTFFAAESDAGLDPLLGKVLDRRYKLEERIGKGGMGTVYRAEQIAMRRTVAVKVMNADLCRNNDAVKRFHREARAASSFDHPHAIRVFDFGQAETRELFMVMELLRGRSLSEMIREDAPVPVVRTAKVGNEIAKALAAAHKVGLIHRDMKPDNVFLMDVEGDFDFVKVLDFGIAKFVSGTGDSTMTKTGLIVGTPHFMAPEQARPGTTLTPALDVYALGVILYTLLTGRHPFVGETPLDALMAHLNEPVPDLPASVPASPDFRSLVKRMLAKAPSARPSAAEVVATLDELRQREVALAYLARQAQPPGPAETSTSKAAEAPEPGPREPTVALVPEMSTPDPRETVADRGPPISEQPPPSQEQENAAEPVALHDALDSLEMALPRRPRAFVYLAIGIAALVLAGLVLVFSRGGSVPEPAPAAVAQPKPAAVDAVETEAVSRVPAVESVAAPAAEIPALVEEAAVPHSPPKPSPSAEPEEPTVQAKATEPTLAKPAAVVPSLPAPGPAKSVTKASAAEKPPVKKPVPKKAAPKKRAVRKPAPKKSAAPKAPAPKPATPKTTPPKPKPKPERIPAVW
jgi:eukaryotic-like serine/threonine-protein kinase